MTHQEPAIGEPQLPPQDEKVKPISQIQGFNEPPPNTWNQYESGCLLTYSGGHSGEKRHSFQHGMKTVFRLLSEEFPPAAQCKAAPDLLEVCKLAKYYLGTCHETIPGGLSARLDAAIAKAEPAS